jgi:AraC-like DNA-binding protein
MLRAAKPLLVLHSNGALREQLRRLEARGFRCAFSGSWSQMREAVAASPPAAILVVDPYDGSLARTPELCGDLRSLLLEFPSATVLAAMDADPERSRDLRTLGEWGVADVICLREDDTQEALYRRLRAVEGRTLQNLLQRTLPVMISGRARMLVMTAAEVVSVGGKARDLARRLHLSERTVLRWSARAGLPAPRRMMAWMRILLASALLDDPGRSVLSVAHACGYASDSSLRRATQDFLRAGPTALRREGAFAKASAAFLKELAVTRAAGTGRYSLRF